MPKSVAFTDEYSVRVAQVGIDELLGVAREVLPILHHEKSLKVHFGALIKVLS